MAFLTVSIILKCLIHKPQAKQMQNTEEKKLQSSSFNVSI